MCLFFLALKSVTKFPCYLNDYIVLYKKIFMNHQVKYVVYRKQVIKPQQHGNSKFHCVDWLSSMF
jgi:hypothetical protein